MASSLFDDPVSSVAAASPGAVALTFAREDFTYGRLDRLATARAKDLAADGASPGTVVSFEAPASPGTIVDLIAIPRTGAALAPVRARATGLRDLSAAAYALVETSGTGADAKSVRLTSANVEAAVRASRVQLGNGDDDRWLLCLPLHHVGGLSVMWRSFEAGGRVLLHQGFDVRAVAAALGDGSATMASLVPTMLHRVLREARGTFGPHRAVLLGGAPARSELVASALDRGLNVLQTYGMTETASQVATVRPGRARTDLGTVGHPLDGVELAFRESSTEDFEILVAGPMVSPGYEGGRPRVGPHATGDVGYLDSEGRLVVEGRIDDVIITGGQRPSPTGRRSDRGAPPG